MVKLSGVDRFIALKIVCAMVCLGAVADLPTDQIDYFRQHGYRTETVGALLESAGLLEETLPVLQYLGVSLGTRLAGDWPYREDQEHIGIALEGSIFLRFHLNDGRLLRYVENWADHDLPEDWIDDDTVSRDDALKTARGILEFVRADVGIDGSDLQRSRTAWKAFLQRQYKGISYESFVLIRISAYDGRIVDFADVPMGRPPNTLVARITKTDAVSIAGKRMGLWFWQRWYLDPMLEPILIIRYPRSAQGEIDHKAEPRLCWEVLIERPENGGIPHEERMHTDITFFIDAVTGEVLDVLACL